MSGTKGAAARNRKVLANTQGKRTPRTPASLLSPGAAALATDQSLASLSRRLRSLPLPHTQVHCHPLWGVGERKTFYRFINP